ncbi:tyrosine-type recombinase/integrase [Enterococcus faecalis]|uniref:tyrosine-type recombinase/integrase n=1 Tax=Enterococcus faecalis TaxID=1351 RepID=UPI001EFBB310|nr:site-specific integrase [Enterococcus faecalis]MDF4035855.1 tyrosine-type recombinase/integrase [Staphylococcus aureus]MDF4248660.1 tyrosine-type recombinase/integrase [Enterococcus faecalis]
MNTWLKKELPTQVKPSTYASYYHKLTKYILPFFKKKALNSVTTQNLQQVVNQLIEKGLSVTTIQTSMRIFKRCLKEAFQQSLLAMDPFNNLYYPFQLKQKIRAISIKEQKQLEEEAINSPEGLPVLLALHTGLRIGEVSALKWSDIDFQRKEITITKTLQRIFSKTTLTKTEVYEGYVKSQSAHRIIPLNKKILAILRQRKAQHEGKYVAGRKNTFLEPRVLTYQFKKILRSLNLPNVRFHQLRHTFATRLLEKGADIVSVSALLDHQSVKMTLDTYADSLMTQRKNG